jgi:hypothetical protein
MKLKEAAVAMMVLALANSCLAEKFLFQDKGPDGLNSVAFANSQVMQP